MHERLLAEAELCERIASACADEASAQKFRQLARECQASAAADGGGRQR